MVKEEGVSGLSEDGLKAVILIRREMSGELANEVIPLLESTEFL